MAAIDPQTILQSSETYADNLKSDLADALDQLKVFLLGRQTWVDFAPPNTFSPTPPVPIPNDQLPVLTPAVFGAEFGDPTSEILQFKGHTFLAPMLDSMQTTLMGWITSGGVGISDDIQNAMFENDRQRRLLSLSDTLDALHSKDAKRGFAYFTGWEDEYPLLINHNIEDSNRSWKITEYIGNLAQQNVQAAIGHNISIEQLQSGFALGFAQVWENLKRLIIEKFKVEVEARIEEFKALMEGIIAGYQLEEVSGRLSIQFQDLLMRQWEVQLQNNTERTKALISEAENQTHTQLAATEGYVKALADQISAALLQTNGIAVTTSKG